MAAPTITRPATQTEIAQQGAAPGATQAPQQVVRSDVDPYSLTPAQFLEYQRRKLMPDPYGNA